MVSLDSCPMLVSQQWSAKKSLSCRSLFSRAIENVSPSTQKKKKAGLRIAKKTMSILVVSDQETYKMESNMLSSNRPTSAACLNKIDRILHVRSPYALIDDVVNSVFASVGDDTASLYILVLLPSKRKFEIVTIPYTISTSTVGDLLDLIPVHCDQTCFRSQSYRGICRPTNGIEILDRSAKATGGYRANSCKIMPGELLVAIPPQFSGTQCMFLSQSILRHPDLAKEFQRTSLDVRVSKSLRNQRKIIKMNREANRIRFESVIEDDEEETQEKYVDDDDDTVSTVDSASSFDGVEISLTHYDSRLSHRI